MKFFKDFNFSNRYGDLKPYEDGAFFYNGRINRA